MYKFTQSLLTIICLLILTGCASMQQRTGADGHVSAAKEDPQLSKAKQFYLLGREHYQKSQYAEAVNAFEKAIELKPDYYEAYGSLGVVYSILGEDELGISLINEAIKLAPSVSDLHNNLGYALLKQGRNAEAAGAFERALQLDPRNVHARNNLKSAYKLMGCTDGELCGQWQEPKQP
ncbi:MAG: tetratricopeptide repeat protein [Nitrosomonadaceae bacterium]|nr:tetratricopeptide repeat protein [Nitrosomonadaceae bacterium]